MKTEEKDAVKSVETSDAQTNCRCEQVKVICDVCGHGNPAGVGICEMCSNYLFEKGGTDNGSK